MGNHALGAKIGLLIQEAYSNRKPEETAIEILDRYCKGRGGDAEWEAEDPENPGQIHPKYASYTDPTPEAGLGMLMVEAFAPNGLKDLSRYHGALGYVPSNDSVIDRERYVSVDASYDLWETEVYGPFRNRYNFW